MKNRPPKNIFTTPKRGATDFIQLGLGAILSAIAVNSILVPKEFAAGGLTGLSILIHNIYPLNLGAIFFLCNIPLFILAWMAVGRRFFFYSLLGAILISLAMAFITIEI